MEGYSNHIAIIGAGISGLALGIILQRNKIPCVILARKNSKGLKQKNTKRLNNLSLIEHSILYAKKSKLISDIIISTDD